MNKKIQEYLETRGQLLGLHARLRDDSQERYDASMEFLNQRVYESGDRRLIQQLTLKDDKPVWLVGGELVLSEDGSVDVAATDAKNQTLAVVDADGAGQMISAKDIKTAAEAEDLENAKAQVYKQSGLSVYGDKPKASATEEEAARIVAGADAEFSLGTEFVYGEGSQGKIIDIDRSDLSALRYGVETAGAGVRYYTKAELETHGMRDDTLPEAGGAQFDPRTISDSEKTRRGDMLRSADAVNVDAGQIVATEAMSARKVAEAWWDKNVGAPLLFNTEVGDVEINRNSIESSLAHRYGQAKLDAITSLADGFGNAVYLGTMPDFTRQEGVDNHFFAYPIMYNGKRCYVFCRAMQDSNKNRLYVHEVFVEDKISKGDTLQTAASQPHGGIALYRDILANVLDDFSVSGGKVNENVSENTTVH
ncbi:MAG: hypothetical protein K2L28_08330 [Muribaculaceae bacterium]|nr:hypothetical protein [Muribaculaceae bacterium]